MKILKLGGLLLLCAAAIFFGFHFFFGGGEDGIPGEDLNDVGDAGLEQLTYYQKRAEALEQELLKLKEQQYSSSKQYEDRISALELLLKAEQKPESSPTPATYTYTVTDNKITITGYSGDETHLTIPSAIDGLPVVAIGREAFRGSSLEKVILPDSIKTVDWFAFYGSSALAEIHIPQSVIKIEYGVFDGCGRLTVYCAAGSYADKYARSYGMSVQN